MVVDTLSMRDLRQWLVWRLEERNGELTKVPYTPRTGQRTDSTAPDTWGGYEEAVSACKDHSYAGIGFVFTPEDVLCGVDLDKCLDPETGEIEGWARAVIEELDSYTEISPSGKGVHVLVRAALPEGRNRKGRFEVYDRGRYFTVTGKHLAGSPQTIASRQEELRTVVRRVFGEESTNGHTKQVVAPEPLRNDLTDGEVIQKALAASNGARFSRLWNGDTSGYGSHAEADLALCGMLAFWTSRCYSWLRRLMWEEGRSVSGEYLKMAAGTLSAHAEFSGESRELYTRAAWHEGVLYYELRPGKVVRVGPGGWTFEAQPPVLFRRYPNIKLLPNPQAGGDLKRLWTYLNLKTERDRRLLLAYVATVPLSHIGRPILSASGPMGSGKTTAGRLVKRLLDPRRRRRSVTIRETSSKRSPTATYRCWTTSPRCRIRPRTLSVAWSPARPIPSAGYTQSMRT